MRLLLDTHVLIWALTAPERLSALARAWLEDSNNVLFLSSVSVMEVLQKHRLGKLPQVAPVVANFELHLARLGMQELAVTHAHAKLAGRFVHPHRDPFDRLLAAQASIEGLTLLSRDPAFSTMDVSVRW